MSIEQIVIWIIVGGIAGLLADAIVKGIRVSYWGRLLAVFSALLSEVGCLDY